MSAPARNTTMSAPARNTTMSAPAQKATTSGGYTSQGIDRLDARHKVTGKAVYAAEVAVANLAHAVIVGSTVARGAIKSLDVRAARQAPGVLAVLTHENAPRLPGARPAKKGDPSDRVLQLLQDDRQRSFRAGRHQLSRDPRLGRVTDGGQRRLGREAGGLAGQAGADPAGGQRRGLAASRPAR